MSRCRSRLGGYSFGVRCEQPAGHEDHHHNWTVQAAWLVYSNVPLAFATLVNGFQAALLEGFMRHAGSMLTVDRVFETSRRQTLLGVYGDEQRRLATGSTPVIPDWLYDLPSRY